MAVTRTVLTYTAFSGRRKDGKMIPKVMPQFDGSPYASGNCAAASEAVRDITDNAQRPVPGNPWQPTGASIRSGTGDTSGGLMPTQTAAVSLRRYGIGSDIRIVDWDVAVAKLWAHYGVTLLVSYRPIAEAGLSGSPGFYGNHSVALLGIRRHDTGLIECLMSDPLADGRRSGIPEGARWVSISILKRASAALTISGRTLASKYGSNKAYCSFAVRPYAPPPEPVGVTLRFGAHKVRPKRLRCLYDRTIVRTSPKRLSTNHARVVDRGFLFDAYQRVDNAQGSWVGNKAGTRWVFRPGFKFVRYI